jgi:PhzF family phenazine biosynthesis protein
MPIPLFQIDAFTSRLFAGNPAAVCPLEKWLDDRTLQAIAAENNLSETAFYVPEGDHFALRWFTPSTEVELCGHATLATAFVIFEYFDKSRQEIRFSSRSGTLIVRRQGDLLALDFPRKDAVPCEVPGDLIQGLGRAPREVLLARESSGSANYLAVYESEDELRSLRPDFGLLGRLSRSGVIVTSPGESADFASRYFAPWFGVPEDPVTGSSHCTLVPYWASRTGRQKLHAVQLSSRGGELFCELKGERVVIAGRAVGYLRGEILL